MDTVYDMNNIEGILCMPHLRVQNANAISSPMTHGFPAITAFLGLMWALERRLGGDTPLYFNAVGVVCHDFQEMTHDEGFPRSFCLTRNPVLKDGSTAAIVEEGRIHLDISLIFGVSGDALSSDEAKNSELAKNMLNMLCGMRIAGGSLLPSTHYYSPWLRALGQSPDARQKQFRQWRYQWLPGYALVSRADLLEQRRTELLHDDPQATAWNAWLELSRLNCRATQSDTGEVSWEPDQRPGWLTPIPVGYGALSALYAPGEVSNTRDATTPLRFVESLYSMGQWVSPHRLQGLSQLLWYNDCQPEQGRYVARNDFPVYCQ